jgi:hypothetical protein
MVCFVELHRKEERIAALASERFDSLFRDPLQIGDILWHGAQGGGRGAVIVLQDDTGHFWRENV